MNQDKQGCYRVGDLKFYSKLEAIEVMQKTGIHLHWDFNEAVFSSYNWAQEPAESLPELYKRRALQIREKYDYVILLYSGGADSQNILDTFLNNNIVLNEVVTYIDGVSGETHSFANAEAFEVAIPRAKAYVEKYPWLKHRIVDFSKPVLDYFSEKKNRYDWFYKCNTIWSPTTVVRENWIFHEKDWLELIESGKKVCFIHGNDKPRIVQVNGKFVFRFMDAFWGHAKSMAGEQPHTDELFYWSPDLPELVIKQAHIVKNYLSLPNLKNLPFVSKTKSDLAYKEVNGEKWWLSNHGVHKLLYPTWDINTFTLGKSPSPILSPRDKWFFKIESTNQIKENWAIGFKKFSQMLPEYWLNDPKDISKAVKGCWSKDYFLE